jgi:hypothetical protein
MHQKKYLFVFLFGLQSAASVAMISVSTDFAAKNRLVRPIHLALGAYREEMNRIWLSQRDVRRACEGQLADCNKGAYQASLSFSRSPRETIEYSIEKLESKENILQEAYANTKPLLAAVLRQEEWVPEMENYLERSWMRGGSDAEIVFHNLGVHRANIKGAKEGLIGQLVAYERALSDCETEKQLLHARLNDPLVRERVRSGLARLDDSLMNGSFKRKRREGAR